MTFRLKITSPYGVFYDADVKTINVKTVDGYIGVLKNHIPLVAPLEISTMMIRTSEGERYVTLAGGMIYVKKKETLIVTGGSISGNVYDSINTVRFNNDTAQNNNFIGPVNVLIENISLNGGE